MGNRSVCAASKRAASAPRRFTSALRMLVMGIALSAGAAGAETTDKSSAAHARSLPTGGHASGAFVPAWDGNRDAKVSRSEYDELRGIRFAKTDENGDGELDVEEYVIEYAIRLDRDMAVERQASIEQTHVRFRSLDGNQDGAISQAEYAASGERLFEQLDRDKDGRISKQDSTGAAMNAARAQSGERRRERPRSVIRMPTTHQAAGFLAIYDDNGDDVVAREQFDARRSLTFAATDANGDGTLDLGEYEAEFLDRLDRRIALVRQAQLKQAQVRFKSIDDDKSRTISRSEYRAMSARMFERLDTNHDAIVSHDDPAPVRERRGERTARDAERS